MCVTESLCCTLETNTALYVNSTSMRTKKRVMSLMGSGHWEWGGVAFPLGCLSELAVGSRHPSKRRSKCQVQKHGTLEARSEKIRIPPDPGDCTPHLKEALRTYRNRAPKKRGSELESCVYGAGGCIRAAKNIRFLFFVF